jgi:hypothetical protein
MHVHELIRGSLILDRRLAGCHDAQPDWI